MMKEAGLEIDDLRWYLACGFAERLLSYKEQKAELADFICSKRLEAELYDMEDKYLALLEAQLANNQIDESRLREILSGIRAAKSRRQRW